MSRIVAMVPARGGSKRVPRKNLRFLGHKPLVAHVLDTLRQVEGLSAIYLNSEDDVFRDFTDGKQIEFFHRDAALASDTATNDEFALDFMNEVNCDVLIQVLPTSPFLQASTIQRFVETMTGENFDTLISVEERQIACVYGDEPINFERCTVNPPSQTMTPLGVYATALMGWRASSFRDHMKRFGAAYHGADGAIGYFPVRGIETIDIDRTEDFELAEAIMLGQEQLVERPPSYYDPERSRDRVEVEVASILKRDGIIDNDLADEFKTIQSIPELLKQADYTTSWSKRIINTPSNCVTLISQLPGEGNRLHYHPEWDEWWYILAGEWEWRIEGEDKRLRPGDVVLVLRNQRHKITAVGDASAVRLAVSRADVAHVYPQDEVD